MVIVHVKQIIPEFLKIKVEGLLLMQDRAGVRHLASLDSTFWHLLHSLTLPFHITTLS